MSFLVPSEHLQPGLQNLALYLSVDTFGCVCGQGLNNLKTNPLQPSPLIVPVKIMRAYTTWIIHQSIDQTSDKHAEIRSLPLNIYTEIRQVQQHTRTDCRDMFNKCHYIHGNGHTRAHWALSLPLGISGWATVEGDVPTGGVADGSAAAVGAPSYEHPGWLGLARRRGIRQLHSSLPPASTWPWPPSSCRSCGGDVGRPSSWKSWTCPRPSDGRFVPTANVRATSARSMFFRRRYARASDSGVRLGGLKGSRRQPGPSGTIL